MKKTIYINLSGMAFRIEEDAYDRLQAYLTAVEKKLGADEVAKETLEDIEVRMAELFVPVTKENDVAITLKDVEEVIKILGNPEDYAPGEEEVPPSDAGDRKKAGPPPTPPIGKRLYRDPHSRVLGGVCSGLGAYFNVDPILFRLLFIVGLFYGISVLPYIILWIVMPKALTIEQRMQMYGGEPAPLRNKIYSQAYGTSSVNSFWRVFGVIFGIFLLIGTFIAMIALAIGLFFTNLFPELAPEVGWSLQDLQQLLLPVEDSLPILIGLGFVVGIPLLMLFYLGLHLVFQFKKGGKVIGAMGLTLWLAGIALLVFGGFKTAIHFRESSVVEKVIELQEIEGKTLHIKPTEMTRYNRNMRYYHHRQYKIRRIKGGLKLEGWPEVQVIRDAPRFAIVIEKEARGATLDQAGLNAEGTEFFWLQKDSVLYLDRIFTLSSGTQFRGQRVTVRLELPEGINVHIAPEYRRAVRVY